MSNLEELQSRKREANAERDRFALAALQGILSTVPRDEQGKSAWIWAHANGSLSFNNHRGAESAAKLAYELADAMLEARKP